MRAIRRTAAAATFAAATLVVLPAQPSEAHTACYPTSMDPLAYTVQTISCIPQNAIHDVEHDVDDARDFLIGEVLPLIICLTLGPHPCF